MTMDSMRIYSRQDVDKLIAEHLAVHKERGFAHLCAAAMSGAIMGVLAVLAWQAIFN
ncbi:MAG: hypothetical protein KGJ13_09655 [Patescibacteria group bacterium]|nr:hypothetical protein [Patescibacteria group bacterium]